MRVLLMFDVPTRTKEEQKHAQRFRNELIKMGFLMMQYSVYVRITKGTTAAKTSVIGVGRCLPPRGNVRSLIITEKQFDSMEILLGDASFNEQVNDDKGAVLFGFDAASGEYRYKDENPPSDSNAKSAMDTIFDKKDSAPKPKKASPIQPKLFEF